MEKIICRLTMQSGTGESAAKLYRKNHKITGEFTQEQVDEIWLYVSNHIGLFLKWLIDHNFR